MCDHEPVLQLAPHSTDRTKLRFTSAIRLAFVEGCLVDLILELGRDVCAAEDAVLAPREVGFEAEFADGEGEDERFPGDGGGVEVAGEAVEEIHDWLELIGRCGVVRKCSPRA